MYCMVYRSMIFSNYVYIRMYIYIVVAVAVGSGKPGVGYNSISPYFIFPIGHEVLKLSLIEKWERPNRRISRIPARIPTIQNLRTRSAKTTARECDVVIALAVERTTHTANACRIRRARRLIFDGEKCPTDIRIILNDHTNEKKMLKPPPHLTSTFFSFNTPSPSS